MVNNQLDPRIVAINRALLSMLGSQELVNTWWIRGNKAFSDQAPEQVFKTDPHQVTQYIIRQLSY